MTEKQLELFNKEAESFYEVEEKIHSCWQVVDTLTEMSNNFNKYVDNYSKEDIAKILKAKANLFEKNFEDLYSSFIKMQGGNDVQQKEGE